MGQSPSKNVLDCTIKMSPREVEQYFTGTWYEEARLYAVFEKDCRGAKAIYTVLDKDTVEIKNECLWEDKKISMTGKATKMYPKSDIAAFKVKFPWSPAGGYYIVHAEDINNKNGLALVAGSGFNYFWVLSRNKNPRKERVCDVLKEFKKRCGPVIDFDKLIWNDGEKCNI